MTRRIVEQAHQFIRASLRVGETAIDATAGTGADTLFLANLVGPTGRVFALDTQLAAIERTTRRLAEAGVTWVELWNQNHRVLTENPDRRVPTRVGAVMFNLGYLPGGDPLITTNVEDTTPAIQAAVRLLRVGGVMTVVAYTGHPGGLAEAAAVQSLMDQAELTRLDDPLRPLAPPAPRLFAGVKR